MDKILSNSNGKDKILPGLVRAMDKDKILPGLARAMDRTKKYLV